jgi:hypothetical protein
MWVATTKCAINQHLMNIKSRHISIQGTGYAVNVKRITFTDDNSALNVKLSLPMDGYSISLALGTVPFVTCPFKVFELIPHKADIKRTALIAIGA